MVSGQSLAQAWSALLASLPCAQYSVFLAAILFVQPWDHSFTVRFSLFFAVRSNRVLSSLSSATPGFCPIAVSS